MLGLHCMLCFFVRFGIVRPLYRPILVVGSDGAMAPIRPKGGWNTPRGPGEHKEVKGFRVYLTGRDRIIHLASWHQVDEVAQVKEVLQEMARRIPQDKVRIALVGDGASWLWKMGLDSKFGH